MTRSQQMRRHARKMRRHGLQPMIVINHDDQLPDLVVTLVGRALWRYRSELAPLYLAVTLAMGGAVLHHAHPGWWPYLLASGTAAAWALAMFGERIGLALRS